MSFIKPYTLPQFQPVTLAQAKLMCRIESSVTEDDALIAAFIAAATATAEQRTQRSLMAQKWVITIDAFPAGAVDLRRLPVTAIDSIKYTDAAGLPQTLSPTLYSLDDKDELQSWALPAYGTDWPATRDQANAVEIIYSTGYSLASNDEAAQQAAVPEGIKTWIKVAVNHLNENRENPQIPIDFCGALLDRYRIPGI